MKRTLVEILAGLAVLVLMASFHHRLARLNDDAEEVKELRSLIEQTSRRIAPEPAIDTVRRELIAKVDERVAELERRIADATRSAKDASFLKEEVEQARQTAASIKAEIERDVSRTRELVQTYANELRIRSETANQSAERDRAEIEKLSGLVQPDPDELTRDLLLPAVQLNGQDTVGSGTLIRSCRDAATGKVENWVLTAYHVVRNILTDSPESQREGIAVTLYDPSGKVETRGELVAFDKDLDSALLRLRTDRQFSHVARVLPRDQADRIQVWEDVYAIGCPLGNDPIPTRGSIASKHNVLNGTNYWMINAPTYYGNSGGGIFLAESRVLVGVFSKIYTHGRGNPVVIPHMGLCTPIQSIYEWLDREKLGHLIQTQPAMDGLASPPK
ncbi:MAG: trypsin-like peptidase domain-containing protein [Planctomycetes bacterium]|nr:trypsin-like peptidase domain-containing protein [Planctomycetota bacterium]